MQNLFTFQYGSTLIGKVASQFVEVEKFTFQYGSTLIQ